MEPIDVVLMISFVIDFCLLLGIICLLKIGNELEKRIDELESFFNERTNRIHAWVIPTHNPFDKPTGPPNKEIQDSEVIKTRNLDHEYTSHF